MKTLLCIFSACILLVLAACAPAHSAEPQNTPIPSSSPAPIETDILASPTTPPATETSVPSPAAADNQLTGTMLWFDHAERIGGATVYLCLLTGNTCQLDPSLKATTQADGTFTFSGLAAGTYVILYDRDGKAAPPAATLDISKTAESCAAAGFMGQAPTDCQGKTPIFGEGSLTLAKRSDMSISTNGFSISNGSIFSQKFGLYVNFRDGEFNIVEVIPEQEKDIIVSAWIVE